MSWYTVFYSEDYDGEEGRATDSFPPVIYARIYMTIHAHSVTLMHMGEDYVYNMTVHVWGSDLKYQLQIIFNY